MGYTNFPNGITSFGVPLPSGGRPDISGNSYFVENNSGSDGNDGSSWARAFKTFSRAVTISNLDITGSFAARRNTIYIIGDLIEENLTAFPNKCDVIGQGSYDANTMAGIKGKHVIVNSGNYGTRFFNVWFKGSTVAYPIITLASTSSGIQFHGCHFFTDGTDTIGIQATASPFLVVNNCRFKGNFATSNITFGTGSVSGTEITDNIMIGAVAGIVSSGATTGGGWNPIIKGNVIRTSGITINDDDNLFLTVGNYLITDAARTVDTGQDAVATLACGNIITGAGVTNLFPLTTST
jgi:hypothetical protein